MSFRMRTAAGIAAMAFALAGPLAGQSVLLRMAPEEGLVTRYLIGAETVMDMMGNSQPVSTTEMYQTQEVLSVVGEVVELRTAIDSSTITASMPGAAIPDLDGTAYTVKMDTRGRLVELTDLGTLPPETEAVISQLAGGSFFQLPENEVSPGDTWMANLDLDLPAAGGAMLMEMEITYTLVGVDGDLVNVSFEGPLTMTGSAQGMTMDGTGGLSGNVVFDMGLGRLQDSATQMTIDMNVAGMTMAMDVNNTMRVIP